MVIDLNTVYPIMIGITAIVAFVIFMMANIFWVKMHHKYGLVCDAMLPLCEMRGGNFMYSSDTSDMFIMTFFRTFFSFMMTIGCAMAWPLGLPVIVFCFVKWMREEVPKSYKYGQQNRRRRD